MCVFNLSGKSICSVNSKAVQSPKLIIVRQLCVILVCYLLRSIHFASLFSKGGRFSIPNPPENPTRGPRKPPSSTVDYTWRKAPGLHHYTMAQGALYIANIDEICLHINRISLSHPSRRQFPSSLLPHSKIYSSTTPRSSWDYEPPWKCFLTVSTRLCVCFAWIFHGNNHSAEVIDVRVDIFTMSLDKHSPLTE